MGLDLYETMQRAGALVERWKQYIPLFQEVWNHASNREQLTALLITGPDPSPEEMETVLTLIRTVPYLLRSSLQDAAKSLPPSPGGRPRELRPEQRKEICLQIGQLYGSGVELRDAQKPSLAGRLFLYRGILSARGTGWFHFPTDPRSCPRVAQGLAKGSG